MNKGESILLEVLSSLHSFTYHFSPSQKIFMFKSINFILSCSGREHILLPSRWFTISVPTSPNCLRKSSFISSSILQNFPSLLLRLYFSLTYLSNIEKEWSTSVPHVICRESSDGSLIKWSFRNSTRVFQNYLRFCLSQVPPKSLSSPTFHPKGFPDIPLINFIF